MKCVPEGYPVEVPACCTLWEVSGRQFFLVHIQNGFAAFQPPAVQVQQLKYKLVITYGNNKISFHRNLRFYKIENTQISCHV